MIDYLASITKTSNNVIKRTVLFFSKTPLFFDQKQQNEDRNHQDELFIFYTIENERFIKEKMKSKNCIISWLRESMSVILQ